MIDDFLRCPMETRRRTLKRLVFETVPEGEVKETARAAGLETYTLYKMRDGANERYNLIRPELLTILQVRQDFRILDWMEGLFGRIAFKLPSPKTSITDINRAVATVFEKTSRAA